MNNVIYTAIDANYEKYAKACFNSLELNYPDHPLVIVYYNNPSDEFVKYIEGLNNFKIKSYDLFTQYENLGPVNNPIVYLKYHLWDKKEFEEYDNVMHLDCDTLILKPFPELFETNKFLIFDNNENSKGFTMFKDHPWADEIKILANAGIFVIPKKYRTDSNSIYMFESTKKYSDNILYADQSVINLWCHENFIDVSRELIYNFQPQFFSYPDNPYMLDDVKILHFAARKPDTIEFLLWWRVKNGLSELLNNMFQSYLQGEKHDV